MVRMPGFGLDGPWRDNPAFAYIIEDASGIELADWLSRPQPYEPYSVGDPNAGVHALNALLLALEHRRRTGEGVLVEAAMVDAALNVAAEQVIEHSAYGALLQRDGQPRAGGGTAEPLPDRRFRRVRPRRLLGRRRRGHRRAVAGLRDAIGRPTGRWTPSCDARGRRAAPRPHRRAPRGVVLPSAPATRSSKRCGLRAFRSAKVMQPHRQTELPQLASRGFFEDVDHPVNVPAAHSTLPINL